MPLTQLDSKTAFIAVDLQKGIVAAPAAHPTADVVANAARLATRFRELELPVALVHVTGGAPGRCEQPRNFESMPNDWAELVPELDQQPSDHIVTKKTWGAFTNTDLKGYLDGLGITQIVLAGIATSMGVESTARAAHENGFNVTLAIDAMTDRSLEAHQNSVERIFPRLAETGTTDEVLKLLATF